MLRALVIGKKKRETEKKLEEARFALAGILEREASLVNDMQTSEDVAEEELAAAEEEATKIETEKAEAEKTVTDLEAEVERLERELKEIEDAPVEKEEQPEVRAAEPQKEIRTMKRWKEMGYEERHAFVETEEMKNFLGEVRSAIKEKRAISNVGYLIPDNFLGLLRETVDDYSALISVVDKRSIKGTGRLVIEGALPEAVWTEACANLNELNLGFSKVEVDGYKVGGYFKVCNANLEDSDINLTNELITALGQAIAFALDKAILYGTGTKMPVGIVTALAAVTSTPHIKTIAANVTGEAFVKELVADAALADSKYGKGNYFWAMNRRTYMAVKGEFLAKNSNGLYVAGDELPIVGGRVIILGFIPDNVIIGGASGLYLLAERAGVEISTSEHAFWVADQTGFKGTARYDGKVLDTDAYVVIGIKGKTPTAVEVTFAPDTANSNE